MIQLSGARFQQSDRWPSGSIEKKIIQRMMEGAAVYTFQSMDELLFELALRKHIILSAKAMNESDAAFAVFADSRCNPRYWELTSVGGFSLRQGVSPSDAIEDIYLNSSRYAFECATAMVIIYYHAVLKLMGESVFNQFFRNILLYSWHADSDLSIKPYYTDHFLPGDIVYFDNPDFNPQTPQWRGENAVVLENKTYFGHGLGIQTAQQIIRHLNRSRIPEANESAYLANLVVRPSFKQLARLSRLRPAYSVYKYHPVIRQAKNSVSIDQYIFRV
ncbi:protein-glutamine gamma-glutamyltransferase [Domibacillus robiginosus]|uniref:protein-glutamine gamma-glutamyltransferase n=1 Tax=Domibacillus robiginosus TaxID=1071054 RepID=UPI00067A8B1E|nr:protein-glutamine gamma-glutamyltransferase [Domibacillus robiginosus]